MASRDASAAEILWEQLPDYFKPVLDYQAIVKMYGYALQTARRGADQVRANLYVQTADETTLAWWEQVLHLAPEPGAPLSYRRTRVRQKLSSAVPFSIGYLKSQLTTLFGSDGYTVEVDPVLLTLTININRAEYGALGLLWNLLWEIVPAHIEIAASQLVQEQIGSQDAYVGGVLSIVHQQMI